MLNGLIVGADRELTSNIEQAFRRFEGYASLRSAEGYPTDEQLVNLLRTKSPDFIFVGIEDLTACRQLLARIEDLVPGTPVFGICHLWEPETAMVVMSWGVREVLTAPFPHRLLEATLKRVTRKPGPQLAYRSATRVRPTPRIVKDEAPNRLALIS